MRATGGEGQGRGDAMEVDREGEEDDAFIIPPGSFVTLAVEGVSEEYLSRVVRLGEMGTTERSH